MLYTLERSYAMKYLYTVYILLISCAGFSQITTTKLVENKITTISAVPYDSTRNFLEDDVGQYIGQMLFLKGKSESLRNFGYMDFFKDYQVDDLYKFSNVYKGNKKDCEYHTPYYAVAERYFKVLSVIKHPKASSDSYLYGTTYFFYLEDRDNKDTLYYQYNSKYDLSFLFLVVGFVEKQQKTLPGQKFIFAYDTLKDSNDISTGNKVTNKPQDIWACTEFIINEKNFEPTMIVKNSLGETTHIPYDTVFRIIRKNNGRKAYTLQEANNYSKKFGAKNWDKILDSKVLIGFTEEMVKLSWGEPEDINHSSYGDQWVYRGQYLYFENGKLTAFN